MELYRKHSTFCDSGYNSLDLEESKHGEKDDDVAIIKSEHEAESDESFSDWLKKVAKCLHSRPGSNYYLTKSEKDDTEDEGVRCMRIVRSVLDEKTVLGMTKDYLHYAKVTLIFTTTMMMFTSTLFRTLSSLTMPQSSSRAVNWTRNQELSSSGLSSTATCSQR